MLFMRKSIFLFLVFFSVSSCSSDVEPHSFEIDNISIAYKGAFRLDHGTYGTSRVAWTQGPIAVGKDTIWVSSHAHHFSIGGFSLVEPGTSQNMSRLPKASNKVPFFKMSPPNWQSYDGEQNRVTGIETLNESLLVNTAMFYDARAGNSNQLVIVDNAADEKSRVQHGYYEVAGAHAAAGWISATPTQYRSVVGAPYIMGNASNLPINGRSSMGPSMFSWFPEQTLKNKQERRVPTQKLLGYSIDNALHNDLRNNYGDNRLWTEISEAHYGFIPDNSNKYLVIGQSGGHDYGVRYKITRDDGYECGGFCSPKAADYYNYFWLYDLDDIAKSRNGEIEPHQIKPEKFGKLDLFTFGGRISGADYVPETQELYLLIGRADRTQSKYESQPIILVYDLKVNN